MGACVMNKDPAKCKKCGGPLAFKRVSGKLWPMNPDGTDHYDVCRERRYKTAQQGERYTDDLIDTWINNGVQFDLRRSAPAPKSDWVDPCDCGVPPWEVCKHSFK